MLVLVMVKTTAARRRGGFKGGNGGLSMALPGVFFVRNIDGAWRPATKHHVYLLARLAGHDTQPAADELFAMLKRGEDVKGERTTLTTTKPAGPQMD